jgi:peptidoglycan/xylan/chitin deacetylase (PgdA/CDA1 family)
MRVVIPERTSSSSNLRLRTPIVKKQPDLKITVPAASLPPLATKKSANAISATKAGAPNGKPGSETVQKMAKADPNELLKHTLMNAQQSKFIGQDDLKPSMAMLPTPMVENAPATGLEVPKKQRTMRIVGLVVIVLVVIVGAVVGTLYAMGFFSHQVEHATTAPVHHLDNSWAPVDDNLDGSFEVTIVTTASPIVPVVQPTATGPSIVIQPTVAPPAVVAPPVNPPAPPPDSQQGPLTVQGQQTSHVWRNAAGATLQVPDALAVTAQDGKRGFRFTLPQIPPGFVVADGTFVNRNGKTLAALQGPLGMENPNLPVVEAFGPAPPISTCTKPGLAHISFDDGPYQYTDTLLDYLKEQRVPATFFVNSHNWWTTVSGPGKDLMQRMIAEGHEVQSHTATHYYLGQAPDFVVRHDMLRFEREIYDVISRRPSYMRPPGGDYDDDTRRWLGEMGYKGMVMWNIDTSDWLLRNGDASMREVQTQIQNGNFQPNKDSLMILMHDIHGILTSLFANIS